MSPPIVPRRPLSAPLRPASAAPERPASQSFGLANPFIRELARSTIIGFTAAAVFLGVILATDFANLRSLGTHSSAGFMALGLLFVLCGLTFTSAQTAFSVLMKAQGDESGEDDPSRRD